MHGTVLKILLLNGHDGNNLMLGNLVCSTQHNEKGYVVTSCSLGAKYGSSYYIMEVLKKESREALYELTDEDMEVIKEFVENKRTYGHAGFGETALIYGCHPELVRMDRANVVSSLSTHKADYLCDISLRESTHF